MCCEFSCLENHVPRSIILIVIIPVFIVIINIISSDVTLTCGASGRQVDRTRPPTIEKVRTYLHIVDDCMSK